MTSEDQLIARIVASVLADRARIRGSGPQLGIGDDAAVVRASDKSQWVLSCDAFLEGTHFLADLHPADSVGYKALARATSDLAAMGATPRFFLLTLALPQNRTGKWIDQFLGGLRRASGQFGMTLIGGDTSKSRAIFVSIAVIGDYPMGTGTRVIGKKSGGGLVRRSGARPGDRIYVSGTLGAAQLGLLLLLKNRVPVKLDRLRGSGARRGAKLRAAALQAHLYPQIRVELGAFLARQGVASAMIDISDGLSTDLIRLCRASRVGARIWDERIRCVQITSGSGGTISALVGFQVDALKLVLDGGEDYELLFTVPPEKDKQLRQAPGFKDLRQVGEIVRGGEVTLIQEDGSERRLLPSGWDPFRRK